MRGFKADMDKRARAAGRRGRRRRELRVLALLAVPGLALAAGAVPAQALVVKVHGRSVGVVPRHGHPISPAAARLEATSSAAAREAPGTQAPGEAIPYDASGPLLKHSGPVMHSVTTHVVYWDPSKELSETTKGIVTGFFANVAQDSGSPTNVFAVAGQYTDSTGNAAYSSTLGGAAVDSTAYPASGCEVPKEGDPGPYGNCLSDEQIQAELAAYIAANKLPKGLTQQYFVVLPHKVVTCLEPGVCSNNYYCAYHGAFTASGSKVVYSDIPFSLLDKENAKGCQADGYAKVQHPNGDVSGYADVAVKYISHEYIEASTDPLLNAWYDKEGEEIGDKCNFYAAKAGKESDPNAFRPTLGGEAAAGTLINQSIGEGHYYLQSEWDNGASACRMEPLALSEEVKVSPETQLPGSAVSFSASATDPYGEPSYAWSFGDGTLASGASASHTYGSPGKYTVVVKAVDSLTGARATVERTVTVSTSAGSGTGGGEGGTGSGAGGGSGSGAGAAPAPAASTGSGTAPGALPASAAPAGFTAITASLNLSSGSVTFSESVTTGGAFNWLLTFRNGRFGVFGKSAASPCRAGFVRLRTGCRPARVVFAKGRKNVPAPGKVSFTVRPTASGLKALRTALRRHKGLPVTVTLTFQPFAGGAPVSHTVALTIRLRKR